MIELRPFQKRFIKAALAPNVRRAALSISRGNGKSTLAAHILRRCLTPGDSLHQPGKEYILLAGSLEQARLVFKPLTDDLPDDGSYRLSDSTTRMGIRHMATGTTLRVISSRAKSAFGLGANNPLVVADEPGAWEVNSQMNDALDTVLVLSQPRNRNPSPGLEAKGRTDGLGPSLRKSVWVIVIWRLTEY